VARATNNNPLGSYLQVAGNRQVEVEMDFWFLRVLAIAVPGKAYFHRQWE